MPAVEKEAGPAVSSLVVNLGKGPKTKNAKVWSLTKSLFRFEGDSVKEIFFCGLGLASNTLFQ